MNKIFIILIFVVIAFVHGAKKDTINGSFLHFKRLGAYSQRFEDPKIREAIDHIDFECFKEKLQLDKFGDKHVTEIEKDILYKHSAVVCNEEVINEVFSFKRNERGVKYDFSSNIKLINCFKSKLFELQPTSKLISDADHESIKTCNTNFINLVPNSLRNEYVNHNAIVNDLTCGKVSQNDFTINFVKQFLVDLVELDEDVRKSEAKEIFDTENLYIKYSYDCIIKKFEDGDSELIKFKR